MSPQGRLVECLHGGWLALEQLIQDTKTEAVEPFHDITRGTTYSHVYRIVSHRGLALIQCRGMYIGAPIPEHMPSRASVMAGYPSVTIQRLPSVFLQSGLFT